MKYIWVWVLRNCGILSKIPRLLVIKIDPVYVGVLVKGYFRGGKA